MDRVLHVSVALLVVLAGCAGYSGGGTTTPAEHSLSVSVSNAHDVTYEVRVTAIPGEVEGIEVTYENGSTTRYDVASFDALPPTTLRNATAIDAVGPEAPSETFTVRPSEGFGTTLDGVPAGATVVYFVLAEDGPDPLRSEGVVRCTADTENTELDIRIRPDGSLHSSVTCSDEPA